MKEVEKEPPKRPEFRRLKRLYIFALTAIPLSIIFSEVLVQSYLNRQLNDSHIINLAGRQRMLSQKLTKELLLLRETVCCLPGNTGYRRYRKHWGAGSGRSRD